MLAHVTSITPRNANRNGRPVDIPLSDKLVRIAQSSFPVDPQFSRLESTVAKSNNMSADVRDVLEISSAPVPVKKIKKPEKEKRPEGITRELYALLGQNTPPVAVVQKKFKEKPKWKQRASKWTWTGFHVPSRKDALRLGHWTKDSVANDSPFSAFDKHPEVISYSSEEYSVFCVDENWSKEDTDQLFSLCQDFDLHWVHITDRFESDTKRSMEDLKDRYYKVCRSLLSARVPPDQMSLYMREMYDQMDFKPDRERRRKQHLLDLLSRSPAQVAEEEALLIEARKIQTNAKKMTLERQELLRLLETPTASGSITAYTGSQGMAALTSSMVAADKNKKRKSLALTAMDSMDSPANIPGASRGDVTSPARKPLKKLSVREEMVYGVTYPDKISAGASLRSQKISSLKPTIQARVGPALTELGIPARLTMPTTRVCGKYEQLQHAVALLLETKRQIDRTDQENRIRSRASSSVATPPVARAASVES